ncbi:tyrosine-type recombinase/integrase [Tropicibacter naphthalenivorans]|uniref:tyrosine-type recombinase/integrase n=1 Tax=Tropicibacter naphthalenivorans TaxID=441103 RepID=UPI00190E6DDD|nr:site-specific integrase [Tropicibacter naphthalenivorans]
MKKPGRHSDGDGLLLVVRESGAKSWLQRVSIAGKRVDLGLGIYPDVSLSEAREKAQENRRAVAEGKDPRKIKAATVAALKAAQEADPAASGPMTWAQACEAFHRLNEASWRNSKHAAQVLTTLNTYTPKMRDLPVAEVTQREVYDALSAIWLTKPETARRVAQRIGKVLQWARANGEYPGSPLDLMAAVKAGLPSQKQVSKVQHHKAVPYADVSTFIEALSTCQAMPSTRLSLEFLILTASRSGEVRGALWQEIDTQARLWVIPAERMKADREHRVPLCDRALAILEEIEPLRREDGLIFPGMQQGRPVSENTYVKLMRELGFPATAHGFRSSFRQWVAECTNVPREVAERCLAHVTENAVERAYQRSDHLDARRDLMDQWSRYIDPETQEVVVDLAEIKAKRA